MGPMLHRFKAATFDEAYQQMVRALGKDAVVVNTTEIKEGGLLGLMGNRMVELTAMPASSASPARPRSLPEKRYEAQRLAGVGSNENIEDTVAFFRQVVGEAQARMARQGAPKAESASTGGEGAPAPGPEADPAADAETSLRREVHEMRELLQVLVAETPGSGLPPEFTPWYRMLAEHGVCRELAATVLLAVLEGSDPAIIRAPRVFAERLKVEIQKRVSVTGGIQLTRGARRSVALVGATGVGKTTNLAKLAALFAVQERAKVALVTTDTYRVAAPEQLRVYANIVGLPMMVANSASEFVQATQAFRDYDLILIDTAGGSQFNLVQIQELQSTLQNAPPDEVMLVVSANTQLEEMRTMAANFGRLRPTSLLFSKLDETKRFGAMFSLTSETGLPLSYFSTGQNVPDDIDLASTAKLAQLLTRNGGNAGGSSAESSGLH